MTPRPLPDPVAVLDVIPANAGRVLSFASPTLLVEPDAARSRFPAPRVSAETSGARPSTLSVEVTATWTSARTAPLMGAAANANALGGIGTLVPECAEIRIPVVDAAANEALLESYGARLLRDGDALPGRDCDLALLTYEFADSYLADFVMHERGGGGVFLETHRPPHLLAAADDEAGGALLLGKKSAEGRLQLTAFSIPRGTAVFVGSEVIHGNTFLRGTYAIGLATGVESDTVVFRERDTGGVFRNLSLVE